MASTRYRSRTFLKNGAAAAAASLTIVPRHVLAGLESVCRGNSTEGSNGSLTFTWADASAYDPMARLQKPTAFVREIEILGSGPQLTETVLRANMFAGE
jgi:hypothetical protein